MLIPKILDKRHLTSFFDKSQLTNHKFTRTNLNLKTFNFCLLVAFSNARSNVECQISSFGLLGTFY